MPGIDYAKKITQSIIKDLKQELTEKPFFIVTEADLQGYLYFKLLSKNDLSQPFFYRDKENFRIHLEFPRYYYEETDKIRKKGRYDIAILRKEKCDELVAEEEDLLDRRRVEVGFELKLDWDSRRGKIIQNFRADISAFENKDKDGKTKIVADSAVIINVNVGVCDERRSSQLDLSSIQTDITKEISSRKQVVTVPLFYVYLESYRKQGEMPQEMTILQT
jgi:hypothetical protein